MGRRLQKYGARLWLLASVFVLINVRIERPMIIVLYLLQKIPSTTPPLQS